MIEIFILIYCSRAIKELAWEKNESPLKWRIIMFVSWFVSEIIGIFVVLSYMGEEAIIPAIFVGLFCGFSSYLVVRSFLKNINPRETKEIEEVVKKKTDLDHFR